MDGLKMNEFWESTGDEYIDAEIAKIRAMDPNGRDVDRIPTVINLLWEAWAMHPQMRLGQLVECIAGCNQFYMEDDEMARRIEQFTEGAK